MADKIIKFTIKDGEIKQDLVNWNGVGCTEMSAKFNSLGAETHRVLKPEIHNQEDCGTRDHLKA